MNQSSNTVRTLETRVRALELECARLNERLRAVGAALGGAESPMTRNATSPETRTPTPQSVSRSGGRTPSASRDVSPRHRLQTGASPPLVKKSTGPKKAAPSASTKKTARAAQPGGTRKWFEKGEALALFGRILQRPMRTRDLMVRVIAAKRKAQLPKKEMERFKWAVHAALKEAVSADAVVRRADGMIALASSTSQVVGKAPGKSKG